MVSENQLIDKKFYETLVSEEQASYAIQVLGEAYLEEQKNELPELGEIRYSQGELYYHFKDYEAAIFKWESIASELRPWARKNSADAYYQLGMLSTAEDLYKSIEAESLVLRAEVALQLFSLYIEEARFDLASRTIKDVVDFHPDYPNVTEVARSFFEDQRDWNSAIDLAANEGIRTGVLTWFDVLQGYVDYGYTAALQPEYFVPVLETLHAEDSQRFEKLVLSLWAIYEKQPSYFTWLNTINTFFMKAEIDKRNTWYGIVKTYKDTYISLLDGSHFIKELEEIIPNTLTNWLKLTDKNNSLFASTAVLAWNEIFRGSLDALVVQDAEAMHRGASVHHESFTESIELYETIIRWAEQLELQVGEKSKWMVNQLMDRSARTLLIAGMDPLGSALVINGLSGEEVISEGSAAFITVSDSRQPEINQISNEGILPLPDLEAIEESSNYRESIFEVKFPSLLLEEQALTFVNTPGLSGSAAVRNEFYTLTHMADGLLVTLDAQSPFTERERELVLDVRKRTPHLPIHFVLTNLEKIFNEHDAIRILEDTADRIHDYIPEAELFAYSSQQHQGDAASFIWRNFSGDHLPVDRTGNMLFYIRKTLAALLEKRIEMENQHVESIRWNEEMVIKLNGAIHQVTDQETENVRTITNAYKLLKDEVRNDLTGRIPDLLRDCASLLKEDSDFRRIHVLLNEEMNVRIQDYVKNRVLPKFHVSLQEWINQSKEEFNQSQLLLNEMAEGFNTLYGDERIELACDYRVLDDWSRDAERMTSMVQVDDMNILMRHTPSQLLLKGAGKLFGGITQNKGTLYNQYKKYLETMDYDDVASAVAAKFLSQFVLFEKSLERDIAMFFRHPYNVLNQHTEQCQIEISDSQSALDRMRELPELYRDPITLYKIRLRQYEMIQDSRK